MKKHFVVIFAINILFGCSSQPSIVSNSAPANKDDSITIHFGGGDGSSIKSAITLIAANSEMAGIGGEVLWAQQYLPGWHKTNQALITDGRKNYDAVTYQSSEGKKRTIYFDISTFFGKF